MAVVHALTGFLALALAGAALRAQHSAAPASPAKAAATPSAAKGKLIEAKPPPLPDDTWPCSTCHTGKFDPRPRKLEMHDDIQGAFNHDSENRWCLDCHDGANREMLHLINGTLVPFTESYRLCGQCHGDKYRDWRRGVHGKRTGEWNGERTYLLCVHCHNPHNPRFQPLRPMPPPQRPSEVRR
ncbi:MAG: cytochrome c3 family protein [Holophagaceae bacterium]